MSARKRGASMRGAPGGKVKLEPIVLYEGKILDGRNRYRAAQEAGVVPTYLDTDCRDPLAYVIRHNLNRRHLSESQRAVIAEKLANMPLGGAIYRSANLQSDSMSIKEASKLLNVSPRTAHTIRAVKREAPELVEKIERGEMSANEAQRAVKEKRRERVREDNRQLIAKVQPVERAAKAEPERFVSDVLKRLEQIDLPKRELAPEPPPAAPHSKRKPKYTYPTPWNELQQQRRIATAAVRGIVARRPVDYRLEMRKLILETTTPIPKLPGVLNSYAWDPGLVVEVLEEILYAASELNETVHFSALTKKIFFGAVIERLSHAQLAKRHGVTRQVIDRHIARVERFLKKYSLVEAKKGRSGGALPQRVGGPDDASSRD